MESIPIRTFTEWAEYFQLEPWGDEVTNHQLAELCAIVAQFAGCKGAKAKDFMPTFKTAKPKRKSNEELHAVFASYVEAHNAVESTKNG